MRNFETSRRPIDWLKVSGSEKLHTLCTRGRGKVMIRILVLSVLCPRAVNSDVPGTHGLDIKENCWPIISIDEQLGAHLNGYVDITTPREKAAL